MPILKTVVYSQSLLSLWCRRPVRRACVRFRRRTLSPCAPVRPPPPLLRLPLSPFLFRSCSRSVPSPSCAFLSLFTWASSPYPPRSLPPFAVSRSPPLFFLPLLPPFPRSPGWPHPSFSLSLLSLSLLPSFAWDYRSQGIQQCLQCATCFTSPPSSRNLESNARVCYR